MEIGCCYNTGNGWMDGDWIGEVKLDVPKGGCYGVMCYAARVS